MLQISLFLYVYQLLCWCPRNKNVLDWLSFPALFPKKKRKYANNSKNMLAIQHFCLSLHPKVVRKYAKYSEVWIELTGIIISSNS